MLERSRMRRSDSAQSAKVIATDELIEPDKTGSDKNPAAVALGRLGGKKGGLARAKSLSPEERSAIARKAAKSRWKDHARS
jgi:hypothetical protein